MGHELLLLHLHHSIKQIEYINSIFHFANICGRFAVISGSGHHSMTPSHKCARFVAAANAQLYF